MRGRVFTDFLFLAEDIWSELHVCVRLVGNINTATVAAGTGVLSEARRKGRTSAGSTSPPAHNGHLGEYHVRLKSVFVLLLFPNNL